jgi:hypothetical protein
VNITKRPDGWWITDTPADYGGDVGPYTTKAEADDDRRGLERFERGEDRRGSVTTEK